MDMHNTIHRSSRAEFISRTKASAIESQCPVTANLDDRVLSSVVAGIGILELAQVVPASEICGPYLEAPTFSDGLVVDLRLGNRLRHLEGVVGRLLEG